MITKPFIELFKHSDKNAGPKKTEKDTGHTEEIRNFVPLFQKINQITSGREAPKQLANSIFHTFSPSTIIVTKKNDGALKVAHVWHNPAHVNLSDTEKNNIDSSNAEIIGKPASFLCDEVKNTKQIQTQNNVTTNYPNDPILHRFKTKAYTGFPLFDDNNNITYVISLLKTENNQYSKLELDLISSVVQRIGRELTNNTVIARQDEALHAPNEQLTTELEVANKSLESLSYAISHDLRAPLRTMDSFSLILVEDFSSDLPDEAISHLSRIRRSAKRMGDMIEDLLWLTKVTRRKLERQEVDLSKVATNILNEIKEKQSDHTYECHVDPHMMVNADKNLLKIALQNLLNNACKFANRQKNIVISLTHTEENGECIYKLHDNGCGFDMAYYDQLFEPFKKLHDSDEYKKGTGIGLATVKRIIQRHGGRIWAESELDEGTSIFFTLGGGPRT